MLFVPSVWQDIRKYYEGSYVKFNEYGDKLFFISRVREHEVVGSDEDGNPFSLTLDEEAPYSLTYNLPHKGLFILNGATYLLYRIPAQQYSRGITTGNTKILDVAGGGAVALEFRTLKAFVEKQPYVSMEEALFGKGDAVSQPLTRRFSFYKPKQMFYVDNVPIAQFIRKTKTISPISQAGVALLPELKALAEHSPQISFA